MAAGHRTDDLLEIITRYFGRARHTLDDVYTWRVPTAIRIAVPTADVDGGPPSPLDIPFERGGDSLAKANIRLKRTLHAAWKDAPPHVRHGIATWYVAKWGGVKRNNPGTVLRYVEAAEESFLGGGIQGIASWSKVLVVRNPDLYAIFDARVATSINALQIMHGHGQPILFPSLKSQNGTIDDFQQWQRSRGYGRNLNLPKKEVFPTYLGVLGEVARASGLETLDEVEMVLFAYAEELALEAMSCGR